MDSCSCGGACRGNCRKSDFEEQVSFVNLKCVFNELQQSFVNKVTALLQFFVTFLCVLFFNSLMKVVQNLISY